MIQLPSIEQVQQAYEPIDDFLQWLTENFVHLEQAQNSVGWIKMADELELELSDWKQPFKELAELRALSFEQDPLTVLQPSDIWVVEVATVIADQFVQWLRSTAYHIDRVTQSKTSGRTLNIFDLRREEIPVSVAKIEECRDYLLNEKSRLIHTIIRLAPPSKESHSAQPLTTEPKPDPIQLAKDWIKKPRVLNGPTAAQKKFVELLINGGGYSTHDHLSKQGKYDWTDSRKGATNMAKRINETICHIELWSIIPENNSGCQIVLNSF